MIILFVIERTKKLDKTDSTEVVATLEVFERRLIRHAQKGNLTKKILSSLRLQSRDSSQACNFKGKKLWKKKDKGSFKNSENLQKSLA